MKKSITIISILQNVIYNIYILKCKKYRVVISSYHRLKEKYKLNFKLYDSEPLLYIYKGISFYIYSDFPDKLEDKSKEEIDKAFSKYNHIYYKIEDLSSFRIDFIEEEK